MGRPWERKVPNRPTKRAINAAYNMQAPPGKEKPLVRAKARKLSDDGGKLLDGADERVVESGIAKPRGPR